MESRWLINWVGADVVLLQIAHRMKNDAVIYQNMHNPPRGVMYPRHILPNSYRHLSLKITVVFRMNAVLQTKRERPQFQRMLDQVRAGDTIVVWKLDRLARSTRIGKVCATNVAIVGVKSGPH